MYVVEVSIVMATINRLSLLKRGLYTWLNQRFDKPYEIIIIDDGSTDGTKEYITSLLADNIIYLYREKDEYTSPASARNLGVKYAKGRYVIFTDPENMIPYNYLQYAFNIHENSINNMITAFKPIMLEEQDMSKIDTVKWQDDVVHLMEISSLNSDNNQTMFARKSWRDNHFSMFKKEVFDRIGGVNEKFDCWGFEGIDFIERMIKVGKCNLYNFIKEKYFVFHQWHQVNRDMNKADKQRIEYGIKGCGKED